MPWSVSHELCFLLRNTMQHSVQSFKNVSLRWYQDWLCFFRLNSTQIFSIFFGIFSYTWCQRGTKCFVKKFVWGMCNHTVSLTFFSHWRTYGTGWSPGNSTWQLNMTLSPSIAVICTASWPASGMKRGENYFLASSSKGSWVERSVNDPFWSFDVLKASIRQQTHLVVLSFHLCLRV